MEPFQIPDDFRAFMRSVADQLDRPDAEKFLDSEDAFQHECGHGGRTFGGTSNYNFTYISRDGQTRWELALREQQIRDIAEGTVVEVDGVRDDVVQRTHKRQPRGPALLVWGEFRTDAFRIRTAHELTDALDVLHRAAAEEARMLRLWSTRDDQVVAVVYRDDCALYVVESAEGYGTSEGRRARTGEFSVHDPGGGSGSTIRIPWGDCIEWAVAKRALTRFADEGDLGDEVVLSGSIPSGFLMMGDFDRASVTAARGEPPVELQATSLPGLVPTTTFDTNEGWAERLLDALAAHGLLRVAAGARAGVVEQLTGLLATYGDEAVEQSPTADWLANELMMIRGVENLGATGGDLQIALRRAR